MKITAAVKALAAIVLIVGLFRTHPLGAQEDWFEKGLKLTQAQRYTEAIAAFSAAIELIPADFEAHDYRGVARACDGDYDGAIEDYSLALEINPKYAKAYNNRGFARIKTGDLGRGLSDFSQAIKIDPTLVDAYNSKAWTLAATSQIQYRRGREAVLLAEKAVELDASIDSLDTLAAAYAADGQFDQAISTRKNVLHILVIQEGLDRLSPYIDHLNSYKAGKALRISCADSNPATEAGRSSHPPRSDLRRRALSDAARPGAIPPAGPLPDTIQVSAYRKQPKR